MVRVLRGLLKMITSILPVYEEPLDSRELTDSIHRSKLGYSRLSVPNFAR